MYLDILGAGFFTEARTSCLFASIKSCGIDRFRSEAFCDSACPLEAATLFEVSDLQGSTFLLVSAKKVSPGFVYFVTWSKYALTSFFVTDLGPFRLGASAFGVSLRSSDGSPLGHVGWS